jgi:hypothetical protein
MAGAMKELLKASQHASDRMNLGMDSARFLGTSVVEASCKHELRVQLRQGPLCNGEESQEFAYARSCLSFGYVRCNAYGGASHLRSKTEHLATREAGRNSIDLDDEIDHRIPYAKIAVID